MAGFHEQRVRTALTGAQNETVATGATDWARCARLLANVRTALTKAGEASTALGGETGPALGRKFVRAGDRVEERSLELRRGEEALVNAANVIFQARDAIERMDREHSAPEPGAPPTPAAKDAEPDEIRRASRQQDAYNASVNAYAADQAARERISRQWADRMDHTFDDSSRVMREIHGVEPEQSHQPPAGGLGPGTRAPVHGTPLHGGGSGGTGDHDTNGGGTNQPDADTDQQEHPDDQDGRSDDEPAEPDQHGPDATGHDAQPDGSGPLVGPQVLTSAGPGGGGPGLGTLGGIAATGAGGGALVAGIRGLAVPASVSSAGVRPIGSTSRSAVSGALGRSGTVTPGAPVSRSGAASGSARGSAVGRGTTGSGPAGRGTPGVGQAGTRGGRATAGRATGGRATGGRTGAASAAAGGVGTGRGRAGRDDDEKQKQRRDVFDDGSDWLDDEGAAPDVLA